MSIQSCGLNRSGIQKVDKQMQTVAGRGGIRQRGLLISFCVKATSMNIRLPQPDTRFSIQAHHRLDFSIRLGRLKIDLVTHNDGRTMSLAWNQTPPDNILGVAPCQRRFLIRRGNSVTIRTAPPRPVGRRQGLRTVCLTAK